MTTEGPDERSKVRLCNNRRTFHILVSQLDFKNSEIINKNLVGLQRKYLVIKKHAFLDWYGYFRACYIVHAWFQLYCYQAEIGAEN